MERASAAGHSPRSRRTAIAACAGLLGLLGIAPSALAVEPLTTAQLNRFCETYEVDPESADAVACIRYIQGFIAGAIATDEWVARNVAKEIRGDDSFIDEFARIRFGRDRKQYGPTYFAEFCIDDSIPLQEVVFKVVRDMRDPVFIAEEELARDAVFRALRQDYACE